MEGTGEAEGTADTVGPEGHGWEGRKIQAWKMKGEQKWSKKKKKRGDGWAEMGSDGSTEMGGNRVQSESWWQHSDEGPGESS